jgi:hypothetical protein
MTEHLREIAPDRNNPGNARRHLEAGERGADRYELRLLPRSLDE